MGEPVSDREKEGGPFDASDEAATVVLADWAALAVENARLYEDAARRGAEAERAVRRLEATSAIARAVGSETDLDRVLELVVKRGRALVDARSVVLQLVDGEEPVVIVWDAADARADQPRQRDDGWRRGPARRRSGAPRAPLRAGESPTT